MPILLPAHPPRKENNYTTWLPTSFEGKTWYNALRKVFCWVKEHFGSLLPTAVSCCLFIRKSEVKGPLWTSSSEQMMNEVMKNVTALGTAASKTLHAENMLSSSCNRGWTTDKSRAADQSLPTPAVCVFWCRARHAKVSVTVYSDGVHIWVNVNARLYSRAAHRHAMWFTATGLAHISQCHPFMQEGFEFSCVMSAIKAELLVQTDLKSFMLCRNAVPLPNHKDLVSKIAY